MTNLSPAPTDDARDSMLKAPEFVDLSTQKLFFINKSTIFKSINQLVNYLSAV